MAHFTRPDWSQRLAEFGNSIHCPSEMLLLGKCVQTLVPGMTEITMKLELYYAPTTCALVPFVNLTEAGAEFEVHPINFRKKQQMSPEYMRINPKHKVPALIIDGKTLTENVAINAWIAEQFPDKQLFPGDSWSKTQAISIHSWCSGGIHPNLSRINGPAKFGGVGEAETTVRDAAIEMLFDNFSVADEMLKGRDYFFDRYSTCDAHFFWCFRRATQFKLDLSKFPNCQAHFDRILQRDSVKKVYEFENQVLTTFAAAA